MKAQALIFDMDDTLYEEKDFVLSGFRAVDDHIRKQHQVSGFLDEAIYLFESGARSHIFNAALERLAFSFDDALVRELVEVYRRHDPEIRLAEDAEWVLRRMDRGVKTGLISDGYLEAQRQKVKALALEERLHTIILTDELGRDCWKPSRVPFVKMAAELGVPHDRCVYIGDNPHKDFKAPNELGWTTVRIVRKAGQYRGAPADGSHSPQYEIESLRQLREIPVLKHFFIEELCG